MAADSANDLELSLKKRARRRLVGAIALVLLMVIVLPMVLQDRSTLAPQEAIKITMPEDVIKPESENTSASMTEATEPQVVATTEQPVMADLPTDVPVVESSVIEPTPQSEPKASQMESTPIETKPAEDKITDKKEPKQSRLEAVKTIENKPVEAKSIADKSAIDKPKVTGNESFTIQVGVFSDPENVKQLQAKLKQVGLASRTEKINTPKGEKIRLRAGVFGSRQEAAYALTKIQEADLTGMVISNN